MTGASINDSSERGWGSTLLCHKRTIVSMIYVPTCHPCLSGIRSFGFSFHVASHGVLSCCISVVVGSWLSARFRGVFWANQVPMGVAVTAAVLLFPPCVSGAAARCFVAAHCFYEVFDLFILGFYLIA